MPQHSCWLIRRLGANCLKVRGYVGIHRETGIFDVAARLVDTARTLLVAKKLHAC